jgi:fumarylacetoacetase
MTAINETHDPALRSWVASANVEGCDFPIQNLPFAVFRTKGSVKPMRGGVAIGDRIVDLGVAASQGIFDGTSVQAARAAAGDTLNAFMALGPTAWSALRLELSRALRQGSSLRSSLAACLVAQDDVEYGMPARIGDYTDFYTSVHHATNIGKLFRPDEPLLPNYKWVPIGYHGRSSSVGLSGQGVVRPSGQTMPPGASAPSFGPCKRLDYELELGVFVGRGNAQGSPIAIDDAESHVFGLCLLNDWSARDIQAWEYQPLGPFLSKNFSTTISPWIVTLEALAPYRLPFTRPEGDPLPLPYLSSERNAKQGALDIRVEARLQTQAMRERGERDGARLSLSSYRHAYWTVAQLLAHHTVGGCNLQPGDLLGTGTLSGPTAEEAGALIEITAAGKKPLTLPGGETRTFLEDGDAVILRAWCEGAGATRIGFGECRGVVLPSRSA